MPIVESVLTIRSSQEHPQACREEVAQFCEELRKDFDFLWVRPALGEYLRQENQDQWKIEPLELEAEESRSLLLECVVKGWPLQIYVQNYQELECPGPKDAK